MSNRNSLVTHSPKTPGFRIAVLVLLLLLGNLATAFGAKPARCSDVPISVNFMTPSVPAAIWNDIGSPYKNGENGVGAVIHFNMSCDGTRDATLGLGGSTRTLWMQFPAALPGSLGSPAPFAGGPAFPSQAFFNIHNVLGYGLPAGTTTYYTKTSSTFPGPDGQTYHLALYPDNASCPGVCAPVPDGTDPLRNQPEEEAWVKVTRTAPDTWLVEGDLVTADPAINRARLSVNGKRGSTINEGQYSMPFKVEIKTLAPLPSVP